MNRGQEKEAAFDPLWGPVQLEHSWSWWGAGVILAVWDARSLWDARNPRMVDGGTWKQSQVKEPRKPMRRLDPASVYTERPDHLAEIPKLQGSPESYGKLVKTLVPRGIPRD